MRFLNGKRDHTPNLRRLEVRFQLAQERSGVQLPPLVQWNAAVVTQGDL